MVYFPNCEIEIYEPSETPEICCYTGELKDTWTLITIVEADFQPITPKDTQVEYGKLLEDTYKIYVDLEVPVTDKSLIKIVGEEPTYEVTGSPERWNRFHNFKKIIVQVQRHNTL